MDSRGILILIPFPLLRLFLSLLCLLLTVIAGCRKGQNLAEAQVPLILDFEVQIELESASVQFDIMDPLERDWQAWIFFSDDLGSQWQPITPVREGENQIPLTPPFEPVHTAWSYRGDLSSLPQADVMLEVRLLDTDGVVRAQQQSEPLSIGNPNPPVVQSITVPTGPEGGPIPISAVISDPEQDHISIQLEWSLSGVEPWYPATLASNESELVIPVDTEGTSVELSWLSHIDTPNVVSPFARVRISASDASGEHLLQSLPISLNTVPPQIESLTIGKIPDYLNGSESYLTDSDQEISFIISVPSRGSLISVSWASGLGGATPEPSTLFVSSDQGIAGRSAGSNLADLFTIAGDTASWKVPVQTPLPLGPMTITSTIEDSRGNPSPPSQYHFQVTPGSAPARPFDWHDRWQLDFERDNYAITLELDTSGDLYPMATLGSDGQPDHWQDLLTVGLQSNQSLPAADAVGANSRVKLWIEDAVLQRVRDHFGEDSLPDGQNLQPLLTFQTSSVNATSFIGIGGDDAEPVSYALGRASYDHRNSSGNDERASQRGVFTSNMIQFYWNSWTFRNRFAGVLPGLGTPVGEHYFDGTVLSASFERLDPTNSTTENQRYDEIWDAIDAWSRIVSVIASHEVGHAVGLCANNHPPTGLFGGVDSADFTGPFSSPYHVDTPGLNVMASALGLTSALVEGDSGYRFNELNRAYIAEWITLEP